MELLKEFKKEVEKFEAERQELGNAEKLFDLPITVYPELFQITKDMKGLEQIYQIYEEQKVSFQKIHLQNGRFTAIYRPKLGQL